MHQVKDEGESEASEAGEGAVDVAVVQFQDEPKLKKIVPVSFVRHTMESSTDQRQPFEPKCIQDVPCDLMDVKWQKSDLGCDGFYPAKVICLGSSVDNAIATARALGHKTVSEESVMAEPVRLQLQSATANDKEDRKSRAKRRSEAAPEHAAKSKKEKKEVKHKSSKQAKQAKKSSSKNPVNRLAADPIVAERLKASMATALECNPLFLAHLKPQPQDESSKDTLDPFQSAKSSPLKSVKFSPLKSKSSPVKSKASPLKSKSSPLKSAKFSPLKFAKSGLTGCSKQKKSTKKSSSSGSSDLDLSQKHSPLEASKSGSLNLHLSPCSTGLAAESAKSSSLKFESGHTGCSREKKSTKKSSSSDSSDLDLSQKHSPLEASKSGSLNLHLSPCSTGLAAESAKSSSLKSESGHTGCSKEKNSTRKHSSSGSSESDSSQKPSPLEVSKSGSLNLHLSPCFSGLAAESSEEDKSKKGKDSSDSDSDNSTVGAESSGDESSSSDASVVKVDTENEKLKTQVGSLKKEISDLKTQLSIIWSEKKSCDNDFKIERKDLNAKIETLMKNLKNEQEKNFALQNALVAAQRKPESVSRSLNFGEDASSSKGNTPKYDSDNESPQDNSKTERSDSGKKKAGKKYIETHSSSIDESCQKVLSYLNKTETPQPDSKGLVDIGNGIKLDYKGLMDNLRNKANSPETIARNLTLLAWGRKDLVMRSLDGKGSNRYPDAPRKQAATPLKVNSILGAVKASLIRSGSTEGTTLTTTLHSCRRSIGNRFNEAATKSKKQ